ncbi:hypothetical protein M427DRAFT_60663 [Gonapodya prolifera JEL478]|uniref:F-box domain-containing protein n=1 Tax=Gonapodya prolifera (strain JEL478) TaxID=1344416 RepID=A0A139A3X3_GONPJ|nr:hypothetical protein M427DRAFT_60663 [Gonapodya prolifera JEL478]|eukprot:KXS11414.1 hypothetical protein M427DRAFT_60663 [Gonapodya prolifera JEL478]
MATVPSIPTELLARIIELSSPSSLAAASLVSRQWNSAAQTLLPTLALKAQLKLRFEHQQRRGNQTSQQVDASPSWLLGVQNIRCLPEFERGTGMSTPQPRALLVAMDAEVTIDCLQLSALGALDATEAWSSLTDRIRTRVPTGFAICLSLAAFQFTNNSLPLQRRPANSVALEKALDLCRLLQVPHIQFDRIIYALWSELTPPYRGAFLPAVTNISLRTHKDRRAQNVASVWSDTDIALAITAFTSQRLPFPNAKRLSAFEFEVQLSPSNHVWFRRLHLTARRSCLDILTQPVRQKTTIFISFDTDITHYSLMSTFPNLEVFGTILLQLGMWTSDTPYRDLLSTLPATLHTLHATLELTYLHYAASFSLLDMFTQFSTLLPTATQRLFLTVRTASGPPPEDTCPTGRKLWRAMVEIAKRVVVEVRIKRDGDWVEKAGLLVCWNEQLDELVAEEVIKRGTVIFDRSKLDYGFS